MAIKTFTVGAGSYEHNSVAGYYRLRWTPADGANHRIPASMMASGVEEFFRLLNVVGWYNQASGTDATYQLHIHNHDSTTGAGSGSDLTPAAESNVDLLVLSAGSLSLTLHGPTSSFWDTIDYSEAYDVSVDNDAFGTTVRDFIVAYNNLSTAEKDATTLTISDGIPDFGDASVSDQTYTDGTPISALQLPEVLGGNAPVVYSVTNLFNGLSLDPSTRQITGTPRGYGSRTVTYTATDADGQTDTLTFDIDVGVSIRSIPPKANERARMLITVGGSEVADVSKDWYNTRSDATASGSVSSNSDRRVTTGTETAQDIDRIRYNYSNNEFRVLTSGANFGTYCSAGNPGENADVYIATVHDPDHVILLDHDLSQFGGVTATWNFTNDAKTILDQIVEDEVILVVFAGFTTGNTPPVITNPGDHEYFRGSLVDFPITVTDADTADTVTTSVTGLPSYLSYTNGRISGTVPDDAVFQTYSVTISADDSNVPVPITETFVITISALPDGQQDEPSEGVTINSISPKDGEVVRMLVTAGHVTNQYGTRFYDRVGGATTGSVSADSDITLAESGASRQDVARLFLYSYLTQLKELRINVVNESGAYITNHVLTTTGAGSNADLYIKTPHDDEFAVLDLDMNNGRWLLSDDQYTKVNRIQEDDVFLIVIAFSDEVPENRMDLGDLETSGSLTTRESLSGEMGLGDLEVSAGLVSREPLSGQMELGDLETSASRVPLSGQMGLGDLETSGNLTPLPTSPPRHIPSAMFTIGAGILSESNNSRTIDWNPADNAGYEIPASLMAGNAPGFVRDVKLHDLNTGLVGIELRIALVDSGTGSITGDDLSEAVEQFAEAFVFTVGSHTAILPGPAHTNWNIIRDTSEIYVTYTNNAALRSVIRGFIDAYEGASAAERNAIMFTIRDSVGNIMELEDLETSGSLTSRESLSGEMGLGDLEVSAGLISRESLSGEMGLGDLEVSAGLISRESLSGEMGLGDLEALANLISYLSLSGRMDLGDLETSANVIFTDEIYTPAQNAFIKIRAKAAGSQMRFGAVLHLPLLSSTDGTATVFVSSTIGIESGSVITINDDSRPPIVRTVQSVDHSVGAITCTDTVPAGYATAQNAYVGFHVPSFILFPYNRSRLSIQTEVLRYIR